MILHSPEHEKSKPTQTNLYHFDQQVRLEGFKNIIGIDEAGRGPWAGPVVAAAVIMPGEICINAVNDSKKISPKTREKLFHQITASCLDYAVGIISHEIIDTVNILQATYRAILQAVNNLSKPFDICLIDGKMHVHGLPGIQRCYIKGDSRSFSIACASIVAKVVRDRIMSGMDCIYPEWGFSSHKGYGTREHMDAISKFGLSPVHRKSFQPMKGICNRVTVSQGPR